MHRQSEMSGWTNRKRSSKWVRGVAVIVQEAQSKAIWVGCRTSGFSLDRAVPRILVYSQYRSLKAFDGARRQSHSVGQFDGARNARRRTNGK